MTLNVFWPAASSCLENTSAEVLLFLLDKKSQNYHADLKYIFEILYQFIEKLHLMLLRRKNYLKLIDNKYDLQSNKITVFNRIIPSTVQCICAALVTSDRNIYIDL